MKPLLLKNAIALSILGIACNALIIQGPFPASVQLCQYYMHKVENGTYLQLIIGYQYYHQFTLYLYTTINPSLTIPFGFTQVCFMLDGYIYLCMKNNYLFLN